MLFSFLLAEVYKLILEYTFTSFLKQSIGDNLSIKKIVPSVIRQGVGGQKKESVNAN